MRQNSDELTGETCVVISVTKLDGKDMILNAEWILSLESTPDTLITLTTGEKIMVKDSVEEIARKFKVYKREILTPLRVLKPEGAS